MVAVASATSVVSGNCSPPAVFDRREVYRDLNSDYLLNLCLELNSLNDAAPVLDAALVASVEIDGIECAALFVRSDDAGEYLLRTGISLPEWFPARCPGAENDISIRENLESGSDGSHASLFLKRISPVSFEKQNDAFIVFASRTSAELTDQDRDYMEKLISIINSALLRISSDTFSEKIKARHSLLLERINDAVFALSEDLELQYSNAAFRELVCIDDPELGVASFRETAGSELWELLRERFEIVLDSNDPQSVICEYRERLFNTFISRTADGLLTIMRDISEIEHTREMLYFREKFEGLLINIATDFIEMQGNSLNLGIHDALLNIGVILEVDRAYLFQFSSDLKFMSNTHEWCASNIQPQIDNHQKLKTDDYPWWMNKLTRHETIHLTGITDLPPWAEAERELVEFRDGQSMVLVPIVHGSDLIGFIGFDNVNRERTWSIEIIDLLRIVGDAIGNALERNRMEKELIGMYNRAEHEAQVNAVLLKEVNHRVKNNLSEIIGLLYAQKRYASTNDASGEFVQNLIGRIRGLATVHDMLSSSGWNPLQLTALCKGIVNNAIANASTSKKLKASISSSSIEVNSNQSHALALILNELVRNSLKHALAGRDSLKIKVRMRRLRSGMITLIYSDNGPGYPAAVLEGDYRNLGLDLIQNLIIKNLHGELSLINDKGASAKISFRSDAREDDPNESD
jgi:two-component sensor histidine kinase/PAS domain-containing protein